MDLDSIIYIVIAIGLAVINAVAQKKKKNAQQQKVTQTMSTEQNLDDSEFVEVEDNDASTLKLQDILKELGIANEVEEETEPTPLNKEPLFEEVDGNQNQFQGILDSIDSKSETESIEKLVPIDKTEDALDNAEQYIDSIGEYDYNSEENSISSTAITDALTEEEQATFDRENASKFVENFNAKDAIIYTEVMKPKYF